MNLWHPIKGLCSILSRYLRRHDEVQQVETELQRAAAVRKEAVHRLLALDAEARARSAR